MSPLRTERRNDGRILLLTLDRPRAMNAIDDDLATALDAACADLPTDVDAIVLTGSGRAFSGGGDVTAFATALASGVLAPLVDALAVKVHRALVNLAAAGPLVVAAVNGSATGAGMGLVCACDVAFGRAGATLRAGFSRLGLSPDTGTTYFLPRIVGYRKALEILASGRPVEEEEARALGIYADVIDAEGDAFVDAVVARAAALASAGPAIRETKRLLREGERATLAAQLEAERHALVALAGSDVVDARLRSALRMPAKGA